MHLGLTDGPFVPPNLIAAQESPIPLLRFRVPPRLKVLMSSGWKKGTQMYFYFLWKSLPGSGHPRIPLDPAYWKHCDPLNYLEPFTQWNASWSSHPIRLLDPEDWRHYSHLKQSQVFAQHWKAWLCLLASEGALCLMQLAGYILYFMLIIIQLIWIFT
jgi:hypothetical protein